MDDLIPWLRAQLDEDEAKARAATPSPWRADTNAIHGPEGWLAETSFLGPDQIRQGVFDADHIALHDPARVLAEVDAKRRILDLHGPYDDFEDCSTCGDVPQVPYPCDTLRLLALPYADRPGYREDWRP